MGTQSTWGPDSNTENMLNDWEFTVVLLVIVVIIFFFAVNYDRNHGQGEDDDDDDGGDDDDEDESSGGNVSMEVNVDDITLGGEGNLVESGVGRLGRFAGKFKRGMKRALGKFKRGMKRALGKIRSLVTPSCIVGGVVVVCGLA